jgi:hypothetical protein
MVYVNVMICQDNHDTYMHGRKHFPFLRGQTSAVDTELELMEMQEKQSLQWRKAKHGWILEGAWKMIRLRNCLNNEV